MSMLEWRQENNGMVVGVCAWYWLTQGWTVQSQEAGVESHHQPHSPYLCCRPNTATSLTFTAAADLATAVLAKQQGGGGVTLATGLYPLSMLTGGLSLDCGREVWKKNIFPLHFAFPKQGAWDMWINVVILILGIFSQEVKESRHGTSGKNELTFLLKLWYNWITGLSCYAITPIHFPATITDVVLVTLLPKDQKQAR